MSDTILEMISKELEQIAVFMKAHDDTMAQLVASATDEASQAQLKEIAAVRDRFVPAQAAFVKMVADERYGEVIGCHIIGHGAPDLISELSLARTVEATFHEIGRTVHPHPTLPEAIKEAAMAVTGKPIHI